MRGSTRKIIQTDSWKSIKTTIDSETVSSINKKTIIASCDVQTQLKR